MFPVFSPICAVVLADGWTDPPTPLSCSCVTVSMCCSVPPPHPPNRFSPQVTADASDAVNDTAPVRAPSPIVRPLLPGTMRPLSPPRGPKLPLDPQDPQDLANKKKKGLLSKGKKLLKRLSPAK